MRSQVQDSPTPHDAAGVAQTASGTVPFAVRGQILVDGTLAHGAVVVRDGILVEILRGRDLHLPETIIDAEIVSPGLIDLQVNGSFGVEVGNDPEALRHLAAELPSTGVTAYL